MSPLDSTDPIAQIEHLRILIVSDAAPDRNGVGAYYQDLVHYLRPHVSELELICPRIQENGRWQGGINLPLPGDTTQRFLIPNFFRLNRQVREFSPDIVIAPTPGPMGLAGAFCGRRHGATVLLGFHTWFEALADLYWGKIEGAVNRGYFWLSNKCLFRWSDIVVANSEQMVEIADAFGSKRSVRVGTPVAYDFIHQPCPPPVTDIRRILFAGRLAAEKNLPAIIDAARAHPQLIFSIFGDGPDRTRVEAAAMELSNLNYLGWLERRALMAEIDQHDCLVLPSHVESFGTVALEAMARGRITVVSSHCGITQWPDLQRGLDVIPADSTLAQRLNTLVNCDAATLSEKSRAARDAAEQLNHWSMSMWYQLLASIRTA